MRLSRAWWWSVGVGLVGVCASHQASALSESTRAALPSSLLRGVPHVVQREDFCGEACAEMYLRKLGHSVSQDDVFRLTGLKPALGRGAYTQDLTIALRKLGFDVGPVWHRVAARVSAVRPVFVAMARDLARGVPSIVCMRTGDGASATEHMRLVLGYDARRRQVIFHDPAHKSGRYQRMPLARFLRQWPLRYGKGNWTVIRMRLGAQKVASTLAAGVVPARGEEGHSDADYAQHVMAVREKLPKGTAFQVVVEKPFVVVSDASLEDTRNWAEGTVRWAATRLRALYFDKDPRHILTVYLFKDARSYESNARKLFGRKPGTPYGYYSSHHRALVMNIATGGGTLVHEIVHPYIEANFPDAPAWFNEGLGSLYEQSASRNGRIWGLVNWRLHGLQRELRGGTLPSFRTLLTQGDDAFYADRKGDSYAQARYLCLYLQEVGLLQKFYRAFVKNVRRDPTGYKTLRSVLGLGNEQQMAVFTRRWATWVNSLRF